MIAWVRACDPVTHFLLPVCQTNRKFDREFTLEIWNIRSGQPLLTCNRPLSSAHIGGGLEQFVEPDVILPSVMASRARMVLAFNGRSTHHSELVEGLGRSAGGQNDSRAYSMSP
jgi:hypothetical protein